MKILYRSRHETLNLDRAKTPGFDDRNSVNCGIIVCILAVLSGCSPLKSSPNDEKHQLELTLHEVQTNLDDLRHNINCFQTELQILDGRIKYYENTCASLKQHDLERQQTKIDQLLQQVQNLEKKWSSLEKVQQVDTKELRDLSSHANETNAALTQFKNRIEELEQDIFAQNRRFQGLSENFKLYKVRAGDSLEKIARAHRTGVDKIKKLNDLNQDLIVVGQELKIPVIPLPTNNFIIDQRESAKNR